MDPLSGVSQGLLYSAGQTNISHVIVAPAPAKCEKALEIAPKMRPRSAKRPQNDPQMLCALEIAPKMPPRTAKWEILGLTRTRVAKSVVKFRVAILARSREMRNVCLSRRVFLLLHGRDVDSSRYNTFIILLAH